MVKEVEVKACIDGQIVTLVAHIDDLYIYKHTNDDGNDVIYLVKNNKVICSFFGKNIYGYGKIFVEVEFINEKD